MQDGGQPLFSGILPILVLIALEIFLSILMLKSRRIRRLVSGNPVVVISEGVIRQKNMQALRMTTDELFEQLRQKDVFSLSDVAYAIVETNGSLSVVKYAAADYIRPTDVGIKPTESGPDIIVISDGKIVDDALELSGKREEWLKKLLKKEKTPINEVFVLTLDPSGKYNLIKKEE